MSRSRMRSDRGPSPQPGAGGRPPGALPRGGGRGAEGARLHRVDDSRGVRRGRRGPAVLLPDGRRARPRRRQRALHRLGAPRVGLQPDRALGTAEQKQRWLPVMATGEVLGCFALTEPDYGSNPADLASTAQRTPDGGYRINGNKIFITNATPAMSPLVMK